MDRMGEGDSSHFARPSIIEAVFWILLGYIPSGGSSE